jgi:hypothetical protein
MEPVILNDIPFTLDLDDLLAKLRIRPNDSYAETLRRMSEVAQAIGKPKAYYRIAFVDSRGDDYVIIDGVRLTSRVLRVNLEKAERVFVYVATSGVELEDWAKSTDSLLLRYWSDVICELALGAAIEFLTAHLAERYRPGHTAGMTPGSLTDWPLSEQTHLFRILGDVRAAVGVQLTDSLLMIPRKSVSVLEFPLEQSFVSCQLCPREKCQNRRSPYDPELYDKRYRIRPSREGLLPS